MTHHIFFTNRPQPLPNWTDAFPGAEIRPYPIKGEVFAQRLSDTLVWVHLQQGGAPAIDLLQAAAAFAPGCRRIVLSNVPNDEEGTVVLEAGAYGYTNALAVPEVLQQIASVVVNGGLWVGPELLQKLMSALAALVQDQATAGILDKLSEREREVVLGVARGESNKEIARRLDISDRTVKAHLSAAFDMLGVRDRLQLSILVNGIPLVETQPQQ